ncbi:MAG: LysM peptidoglycan-binding domain-containing protein [Pseudomonadales bacterium]
MMRGLIAALLLLGSGVSAVAAEPAGDLARYLKAGHPDTYTVVKGDTLWDISGRFLDRPWLWPEIWQVNPQIENPHLIYPGDSIHLVWVDGQPRLQLQRGGAGRLGSTDGSLAPSIRSTPLDSAIPTIRLDAVQSFLVENRVVEDAVLEAAPYVLQGASERLVLGGGDRLYVRGVLTDSESYNFVRKGQLYIDPETREVLGREATYIGVGQAQEQHKDIATVLVTRSRVEVQIGDRVLPTEERKLDSNFFPSAPRDDVDGQIISVFSGVTQVGQYDVVVLNLGARESLEVGNVLAIYKRGALANDRVARETIRLPSERAGILMIYRVFEKLSYGVVLMTERPLAVGDEVKNP